MAALDQLIEELERTHDELQQGMADPSVYSDHREAADTGRRLKELEPAVRAARDWRSARTDLAEARKTTRALGTGGRARGEIGRLEDALRLALVERDPADEDVIVEVRQGVGGDEAALWAGEVSRMLQRYAERRGFRTELLSASENEGGGVKETVFAVKGDGALGVQVGATASNASRRPSRRGRIHTSTATVAVMPEAEEVEVTIEDKDTKIDVYRSTGPGGQSVNTTDSAVRITHLPTGIVVSMQDEKSQLQNKQKAMRVLRARLYEAGRERQQAELAASRRSPGGTGERAEKIRTYNFPESRLTDHRVKHTVHRLDQILDGDLQEFTDALQAEERRRAEAAV